MLFVDEFDHAEKPNVNIDSSCDAHTTLVSSRRRWGFKELLLDYLVFRVHIHTVFLGGAVIIGMTVHA